MTIRGRDKAGRIHPFYLQSNAKGVEADSLPGVRQSSTPETVKLRGRCALSALNPDSYSTASTAFGKDFQLPSALILVRFIRRRELEPSFGTQHGVCVRDAADFEFRLIDHHILYAAFARALRN